MLQIGPFYFKRCGSGLPFTQRWANARSFFLFGIEMVVPAPLTESCKRYNAWEEGYFAGIVAGREAEREIIRREALIDAAREKEGTDHG